MENKRVVYLGVIVSLPNILTFMFYFKNALILSQSTCIQQVMIFAILFLSAFIAMEKYKWYAISTKSLTLRMLLQIVTLPCYKLSQLHVTEN